MDVKVEPAILGCQNRVATVDYAAVGMCGYGPPDEHKLRMIHALPGDDESAVVLKFLASMMNLADHFESWRMLGKKRLVWNTEQRSEHKKASFRFQKGGVWQGCPS